MQIPSIREKLERKCALMQKRTFNYLHIRTMRKHQSILTNATVSKDSEIGILMLVYDKLFFLQNSSVSSLNIVQKSFRGSDLPIT